MPARRALLPILTAVLVAMLMVGGAASQDSDSLSIGKFQVAVSDSQVATAADYDLTVQLICHDFAGLDGGSLLLVFPEVYQLVEPLSVEFSQAPSWVSFELTDVTLQGDSVLLGLEQTNDSTGLPPLPGELDTLSFSVAVKGLKNPYMASEFSIASTVLDAARNQLCDWRSSEPFTLSAGP
ncbi:hypothetical protein GF377_10770 [candidate division GN15 bacterium]|nr:hypothetical protein [candidate division GN15 bacterium]